MKNHLLHSLIGGRTRQISSLTAIVISWWIAACLEAVATETPHTATGWVLNVPISSTIATNGLGQIYFWNNVQIVRVESDEPRIAGQRQNIVNGAFQADGSALIYGTALNQPGTWDLTDPQNPVFTPTGGVWQGTFHGTMGADNSLLLYITGYGYGGAIDGLRLEQTLTRAAGPLLDPTIPYLYTGSIASRPENINILSQDFSSPDPLFGWKYYGPTGSYVYTVADEKLVVTGHWPGVITRNVVDTFTFAGSGIKCSLSEGQTVETQVDLVSLTSGANASRLCLGSTSGFYSIFKGDNYLALSKWSAKLPWGPCIFFFYEPVQLPQANTRLSLALTRTGANVTITVRVVNQDNPGLVLYERSVVDTPDANPALTSQEFLALSGMSLVLSADPVEAPYTQNIGSSVGVWQYNHDGQQPDAVAFFDNFEIQQYDLPPLSIARAMKVTWPDAGTGRLEGAPTVIGPWLPVTEPVVTVNGLNQVTVGCDQCLQVFRLR